MSINFLISQAKLIQEVIDAHAPEIEKLDQEIGDGDHIFCLLYTSPSPRDKRQSRMPSSA